MCGIISQAEIVTRFQISQLLFTSQLETEEIKKVSQEGELHEHRP